MSGIPNSEIVHNQMECDDLEVKVDLPLLGLTDVLPFPGEVVLGDICINHSPCSRVRSDAAANAARSRAGASAGAPARPRRPHRRPAPRARVRPAGLRQARRERSAPVSRDAGAVAAAGRAVAAEVAAAGAGLTGFGTSAATRSWRTRARHVAANRGAPGPVGGLPWAVSDRRRAGLRTRRRRCRGAAVPVGHAGHRHGGAGRRRGGACSSKCCADRATVMARRVARRGVSGGGLPARCCC